MKVTELIELLQSQANITPWADVEIEAPDGNAYNPLEVSFNGQQVVIHVQ